MARMTSDNPKANSSKANRQSTLTGDKHTAKLTLYVGFFTLGFIIASVIFMLIQSNFALNSQLVTALSIVVGAYVAVYKFIKHQQRALTKQETNKLTLSSTAVLWALTAVYFLGLWLFLFDAANREVLIEMTMQQPLPLLFSLAMMIILTLLAMRLSLGLFNRLLDPRRKIPIG